MSVGEGYVQYARRHYVGELQFGIAEWSKLLFSVLKNSRKKWTVKRAVSRLKQFCTLTTLSTVTAPPSASKSCQARRWLSLLLQWGRRRMVLVPYMSLNVGDLEPFSWNPLTLWYWLLWSMCLLQSPQWINHDGKILEKALARWPALVRFLKNAIYTVDLCILNGVSINKVWVLTDLCVRDRLHMAAPLSCWCS